MLRHATVGILVHHAGPQVLDELDVGLVDDVRVLSQEMLGDNDPKLLNGSKLVPTRKDVDGIFARVRRDDVPVVGLLEGVVTATLFIIRKGEREGGRGEGESEREDSRMVPTKVEIALMRQARMFLDSDNC